MTARTETLRGHYQRVLSNQPIIKGLMRDIDVTQAELALMGFTIKIENETVLTNIIQYLLNTLEIDTDAEKVVEGSKKYNKNDVTFLTTSTLEDMVLITLVKESEKKLLSKNGVLCYVYNATCPDFSELGYCFFEKMISGKIHRIG